MQRQAKRSDLFYFGKRIVFMALLAVPAVEDLVGSATASVLGSKFAPSSRPQVVYEQAPVQQQQDGINYNLIIVGVIILVILGALVWFFTRPATTSLMNTASSIQSLANLPVDVLSSVTNLVTGKNNNSCQCQCRGGKDGDWSTGVYWDCPTCQNESTGCWNYCQQHDGGMGFTGWSCNN